MGPSLTCGHPVRGHWGLRLRQPLSWPAGPRAGLVCPVLGGQAGLCPVASGAAQKDFKRRKPAPGTGDSSVTPGGLDAHLSEMKVSLHEGSAPLPRQLGLAPRSPRAGLAWWVLGWPCSHAGQPMERQGGSALPAESPGAEASFHLAHEAVSAKGGDVPAPPHSGLLCPSLLLKQPPENQSWVRPSLYPTVSSGSPLILPHPLPSKLRGW